MPLLFQFTAQSKALPKGEGAPEGGGRGSSTHYPFADTLR